MNAEEHIARKILTLRDIAWFRHQQNSQGFVHRLPGRPYRWESDIWEFYSRWEWQWQEAALDRDLWTFKKRDFVLDT